jgi:YNFM family putative membrane transporter
MKPVSAVPFRAIAFCSAAGFCSMATVRAADPLIPLVAEEFHTGISEASIIATAYTVTYGLCQMFHGILGDRFGKLNMILITTMLAALGTSACALADNLAVLGVLRVLGASAASAIIPLSLAFIGDSVPIENRQTVMAKFLAGNMLGIVAGQAVSGIIAEHFGWRGVFLVLGATYVVIAIPLYLELRTGRATQSRVRLSLAGLIEAYVTLARSPRARRVCAGVFFEGGLTFGCVSYFGAFLRHAYGLDYDAIGVLLASFGVGALIYPLTAGRLLAWVGQRGMLLLGGILLALSFGSVGLEPPVWLMPVPIALAGLGFYMAHSTLQVHATQMGPPQLRGIAVALFASILFLGQALGIGAIGVILEQIGYPPVFIACGILLLALLVWYRQTVAEPVATK